MFLSEVLIIYLLISIIATSSERLAKNIFFPFESRIPSAASGTSLLTKKSCDDFIVVEKNDGILLVNKNISSGIYIKELNGTLSMDTIDESSCKQLIKRRGRSLKAIFGIYLLPTGYHLLAVKNSTVVSEVPFDNIHKVTEFELTKIGAPIQLTNSDDSALLDQQRKATRILFHALKRHKFYFSTGNYNILRSFQSNAEESGEEEDSLSNQFFWNRKSIQPFLDHNFTEFITPICNAWIGSSAMRLGGLEVRYTLISRRSAQRQGPRYMKRGSGLDGAVANFVETEQIVQRLDGRGNSSFVQIRGSIPLLWEQNGIWKLRPSLQQFGNTSDNLMVLQAHLQQMWHMYCNNHCKHNPAALSPPSAGTNLVCLNLIDKKGSQGRLGASWMRHLEALGDENHEQITTTVDNNHLNGQNQNNKSHKDSSGDLVLSASTIATLNRSVINNVCFPMKLYNLHDDTNDNGGDSNEQEGRKTTDEMLVRYVWFDYHHYFATKSVSESLVDLYPHLQDCLEGTGSVFLSHRIPGISHKKAQRQTQIIRTNCLDCLDRTNVVQSAIARWMLIKQIALLGGKLFKNTEQQVALPNAECEQEFKRLWLEQGDYISVLYAGSRAMKRDVTKTGIRTKQGLMDDAVSYAKRYIANNYIDQSRQLGIDYLLGTRKSLFEQRTQKKQRINCDCIQTADIYDVNSFMIKEQEEQEEKDHNSTQHVTKKEKNYTATLAGIVSLALLIFL